MAHLRAVLPPSPGLSPSPPSPLSTAFSRHGITALTRHKDREHPPRAHNEGVSAPVHQFKIILRTGAACYLRQFLRAIFYTPSHAYTSSLITSHTSYLTFIYFPPFKIYSSPFYPLTRTSYSFPLFIPLLSRFLPLLDPSLKSQLNLRSSLALHMFNHEQLHGDLQQDGCCPGC